MDKEAEKQGSGAAEKVEVEEKPVFSWKSPDHIVYERSALWYLVVIGAAVVLAGLLVWQSNWTGVALVVVAAFTMIYLSRRKPHEIESAFYEKGFVSENRVYDFTEFKSFWITATDLPKIYFQRTGTFAGQVTVPANDADLGAVEAYLTKHLPEEESRGEDWSDMINRWIKF